MSKLKRTLIQQISSMLLSRYEVSRISNTWSVYSSLSQPTESNMPNQAASRTAEIRLHLSALSLCTLAHLIQSINATLHSYQEHKKKLTKNISCSSAYLLPGRIPNRQQAARWEPTPLFSCALDSLTKTLLGVGDILQCEKWMEITLLS
jgi:hypothetical protein